MFATELRYVEQGYDIEPDPDSVVDLDRLPGAVLALQCQTAAAVPELLTDTQVLDVVQGIEHLVRWAAGVRTRMLAAFADRHPRGSSAAPSGVDPKCATPVARWLPDEIGLTLGVSRMEAFGQLVQAERFARVLPDTLDALECGRIDVRRAEAIAYPTAVLPDDLARAVEAAVLPAAPDATLRQVQGRVRRAIARVDPGGEYRRHREANTQRRVSIRSLEDGMASLWFYGPAEQVETAWRMADRLARSAGPEDTRTLDQRRFDLAVQLLQGRLTVTDMSDVDAAVTGLLADGTDQDGADQDRAAQDRAAQTGAEQGSAEQTGAEQGSSTDQAVEQTGSASGGAGPSSTEPAGTGPATGSGSGSGTRPGTGTGAGRAGPGADTGTPDTGTPDSGTPATSTSEPPGSPIPPDVLADAVTRALAQRPDPHTTVHQPLIHVVVGLDTLLGGSQPAELVGHGPIPATTARALAADGVWKRLVTDPLSGTLLDHGRTTYAPPAGLADHVRARDQVCRGPHCSRRIRDLDHHVPFGGGHEGRTSEFNLYGLCQHCHKLKDAPGWHVLAHPDRSLTWISPHGRRTTTRPFDHRPFTEDPPDPIGPARTPGVTWGTPLAPPEPADPDDDLPPF